MVALHRAFTFWNILTELQQAQLLDYTIVRQYNAGEYLAMRPGLYVIGDGAIVAYSSHESGRRRVAFSANWMEAMLLTPQFLNDAHTFSLELFAREVSEIWYIPYDDWHGVEEWHLEIRDYSRALLSGQMGRLTFGLYAQMEKNISRRIALYLNHFYEKEKGSNGEVVHISHEELAEQTGTTREAVTRNLNILKDAGLIQTGRSKIKVLDPQALKAYANLQAKKPAEGQDEKICQFYPSDVYGARDSAHGGG